MVANCASLEKISGKIQMADCHHEPKCVDTTNIGLAELKELIVELREHRADLRNTPAYICPREDCPRETATSANTS
jgi:hypothetical protein